MNALEVMALVFLVVHVLVVGILLASPGESRTWSYGERWFSVLLGIAVWCAVWWLA